MKTRIVMALLMIGGGLAGIWVWKNWNVNTGASYTPVRVLTAEDRTFIQAANQFLEAQAISDEEASKRAHFSSVRDFASKAAADHRDEIMQLKEAVFKVDPDFTFGSVSATQPSKNVSGGQFDRAYFNTFIRSHESSAAMAIPPVIADDQAFGRFISLWKPNLRRHLTEARQLLDGLPDTASDLPLLLLIGVLCLTTASIMRRKGAAV